MPQHLPPPSWFLVSLWIAAAQRLCCGRRSTEITGRREVGWVPPQACWTGFGKRCLGSQKGNELQCNGLQGCLLSLCTSLEDITHVLFFLVLYFKDASGTELWGPPCCWKVMLSCGGIRFALGEQQYTRLAARSASQPQPSSGCKITCKCSLWHVPFPLCCVTVQSCSKQCGSEGFTLS